mmetsp:Transcript_871/g.1879  ORF Transcript_871/g.1879 Transcript_871/m.1879 type:complete len:282 (-) Transcript_871:262-1107(-)
MQRLRRPCIVAFCHDEALGVRLPHGHRVPAHKPRHALGARGGREAAGVPVVLLERLAEGRVDLTKRQAVHKLPGNPCSVWSNAGELGHKRRGAAGQRLVEEDRNPHGRVLVVPRALWLVNELDLEIVLAPIEHVLSGGTRHDATQSIRRPVDEERGRPEVLHLKRVPAVHLLWRCRRHRPIPTADTPPLTTRGGEEPPRPASGLEAAVDRQAEEDARRLVAAAHGELSALLVGRRGVPVKQRYRGNVVADGHRKGCLDGDGRLLLPLGAHLRHRTPVCWPV